jgi:hypothetical protein
MRRLIGIRTRGAGNRFAAISTQLSGGLHSFSPSREKFYIGAKESRTKVLIHCLFRE